MFKFFIIDTLNQDSISVWTELFVTFFGALLGFGLAFYLAKRTEYKQRRKEKTELINKYKSRLSYLSDLITSSLNFIESQLNHFESLGRKIKEEPTELHLITKTANNDLLRLQNIDSEEVFYAYNQISKEKENNITSYHKIYGCIDYLTLRYSQEMEAFEKYVEYTNRDQRRLQKKFNKLSIKIFNWAKKYELRPNGTSDKRYKFLVKHHMNYVQLTEQWSKLNILEQDFLIPFGKELLNYEMEEFFLELHSLCLSTLYVFSHLKSNTILFSVKLPDIRNEMIEPIETLKAINEKIKNDIDKYVEI